MNELKQPTAKEPNGWWYIATDQSRLRRACKALLLFGMTGTAVAGLAVMIISPEVIATETEPVAAAPASAEDRIRALIQDSMYREGRVNVLSGAVAVQQLADGEGNIRERSITDPMWFSIDELDYLVGKNSLSSDGDNLIIWNGSDVRLCASADDQARIEPTQLGVGIDSTGFAENVGVFRNHTEYPVEDLCKVSIGIPGRVSRTKV